MGIKILTLEGPDVFFFFLMGGGGKHPILCRTIYAHSRSPWPWKGIPDKCEILLVVECKIVPFSLHFFFKNPFLETN